MQNHYFFSLWATKKKQPRLYLATSIDGMIVKVVHTKNIKKQKPKRKKKILTCF
jgi:hypothetical protein